MDYLAINLPGGQTITKPNNIPGGGLPEVGKIFRNAYTILLIVVFVLSLIFIVLGGIQWITSGGDKNKLQAARAKITYAIIGLVVSLLSFFIVAIIGYFFKVNLLQLN